MKATEQSFHVVPFIVPFVCLFVCLFVADPTQVIGLFPELLPSEFRKLLEYPAPPPQLTPGELEKGCLALVEYLTQV